MRWKEQFFCGRSTAEECGLTIAGAAHILWQGLGFVASSPVSPGCPWLAGGPQLCTQCLSLLPGANPCPSVCSAKHRFLPVQSRLTLQCSCDTCTTLQASTTSRCGGRTAMSRRTTAIPRAHRTSGWTSVSSARVWAAPRQHTNSDDASLRSFTAYDGSASPRRCC